MSRTPAVQLERQSDHRTPTFDIARIDPNGEAVIAGRGSPSVVVELLRDGEVLSHAVADQSGEFVIIPPRLPAGTYKLTLRSKQQDGNELNSEQSVSVALEPRPAERSVAAAKTIEKPIVVVGPPVLPQLENRRPVFEAIAMDPDGKFHVRGRARPGAAIKLYLNDNFIASVTASSDEQFAVTINEGMSPGAYRVRLEDVEANSGTVLARAEAPFNVPAPSIVFSSTQTKTTEPTNAVVEPKTEVTSAIPMVPEEAASPSNVIVPKVVTATVLRGDSLWRISRNTYGKGERYPLIFGANRKQIHNPNLIYPGQIFVLPAK